MGMMGSSKLPLPPKLGSSGGAALKGSNMMNQKRSKSSARNIPAKAEPSAKARKQKKAKGKKCPSIRTCFWAETEFPL
jgi:hypothetical protein